jgi:hypothetical protein
LLGGKVNRTENGDLIKVNNAWKGLLGGRVNRTEKVAWIKVISKEKMLG